VHRAAPCRNVPVTFTLDLMSDVDRAFQALGEFVIAFQWVENKYREIGWFILDPERKRWPPRALRTESNARLIDGVTKLYTQRTRTYQFPNGAEKAKDFLSLRDQFHTLRQHRNSFFHSTFTEIKTAGEVAGYLRSDVRPPHKSNAGGAHCAHEWLSADAIYKVIGEYAEPSFRLGQHFVQLVHWYPFERYANEV